MADISQHLLRIFSFPESIKCQCQPACIITVILLQMSCDKFCKQLWCHAFKTVGKECLFYLFIHFTIQHILQDLRPLLLAGSCQITALQKFFQFFLLILSVINLHQFFRKLFPICRFNLIRCDQTAVDHGSLFLIMPVTGLK